MPEEIILYFVQNNIENNFFKIILFLTQSIKNYFVIENCILYEFTTCSDTKCYNHNMI